MYDMQPLRASVLQENLLAGLKQIAPQLGKTTNVLITGDVGRTLTLQAYNGAQIQVAARTDAPGAILVPFKTLLAMTAITDPERIDLELDTLHATLNMKCGGNTTRFKGSDPASFPPVTDSGTLVSLVDCGALKDALVDVLKFPRKDEGSVTFAEYDGGLRLMAGAKCKAIICDLGDIFEGGFSLSTDDAKALKTSLGKAGATKKQAKLVGIYTTPTQATFTIDDTSYTYQTVPGNGDKVAALVAEFTPTAAGLMGHSDAFNLTTALKIVKAYDIVTLDRTLVKAESPERGDIEAEHGLIWDGDIRFKIERAELLAAVSALDKVGTVAYDAERQWLLFTNPGRRVLISGIKPPVVITKMETETPHEV